MLVLVWILLIIAASWLFLRQKYSRFSKYGVKYLKPVPFLGSLGRVLLKIDHVTEDLDKTYYAFPEERFMGKYEMVKPIIIIRDIDLVKKIAIKDFEYFLDHRPIIDDKIDPLLGRNIFALRGQEWKDMRSTLSPAFTSSKMKLMLPLMVEVGNQMVMTLKKELKESGVDHIDVEGKDLTTRYANDVIASCAFGLKVNSHVDKNNKFYEMGRATTTFKFFTMLKFFALLSCPKLMNKLKITLFPKSTTDFFKVLVLETMREREAKNIIRPDMIHLLMEARKGQLSHDDKTGQDTDAGFATVEESSVGKKVINRAWTDNDVVAQVILFFVAGFESISTVMSFALHVLAINPDVQERLYQEIKENETRNGGKFNYKSILDMTYMDMVISEVLRLWPPAIAFDRQCLKDYNLGKPNDEATEDYIIRKGEIVGIPAWSIHRDPKYFTNPLKFDPERFSEENKHNIQPMSYMPFGLGPRNCIGSRFALCEVKVMLYQLLRDMELSPCEKTCIPASLDRSSLNLKIKGGHWIRLKLRH